MEQEQPKYKRWYDYDPVLLQVINMLKDYQTELRSQAEVFLLKIEEKVSKQTIDKFYEMVKPANGNRWYDKDPVISKTVELLRVVPPEVQKAAAEHFLQTLKSMGIEPQDSEKQN
ncbi:MAG: hypothetical protein K6C94_01500 [Candidatus Gastranaerophilales bacterium]|nr:hypothetical protein [Candidatus Gastranaerophilales bacterium]